MRKRRRLHAEVLQSEGEVLCPVCLRRWHDPPGTAYCGSQHGLCRVCGKPRVVGVCSCLNTGR